jgi:hypothetical protein
MTFTPNYKVKLRDGTIHKAINPSTGRILSVKGAKLKAWSALARYVRKTEPRCCTCGAPTTEAGHFIHDSDKENKQLGGNELWYDIRNIHGQCGICNRWKSGNGVLYSEYMEKRYGFGITQELRTLYNTPRKWTIPEILAVGVYYKDLFNKLTT